jgi:hypothetical protein
MRNRLAGVQHMRKNLLFLMAIVTIVTVLFGTAVKPVAAAGNEHSIQIIFVQYIPGKGVVFKFQVKGDFGKTLERGTVTIKGSDFKLTCGFTDFGDLSCIASQGLSKYVGEYAHIFIAGYSFNVLIRGAAYCYNIIDYPPVYPYFDAWKVYGTHCQGSPAQAGDSFTYYNPDWDHYYSVYFFTNGTDACAPDFGEAYYFDDCRVPN